MKIFKINPNTDFNEICNIIKPHKMGQKIMSQKSKIHFFLIKDIKAPAANILKQDALRVGAELITHKEVILAKEYSNALLMATQEQIVKLIEKEKMQDFKLKELANFLKFNFSKPKKAKLMGVININEDSFNPQSRAKESEVLQKITQFIEQGADYIDIGAVSSRPKSVYCGKEEEFKRLKNTLDMIYQENLYNQCIFSLDSFDEYCLEYALDRGFKLINDISGLKNENLAKLALKYKATYMLMHMQNTPQNMQDDPHYEDVLAELDEFFAQKLAILERFGVKDVILDVGIGFGKSPWHNMMLIKHLEHFLHFEKELLIGASRKSVINAYFPSDVENRLAGSLYLHLEAFKNGASILRVHDIYDHKQMFELVKAMDELSLE
ncbi:dihydropteroate synthase [Campylobacter volucris]|uniref:dihydropteroate synthase n=1 Tax=Campylobacter volucris TaxID=1031542 RepID=A0AAE5YHU5_9BACT|nr:dihydropteroate synthase [Campylobacter volucris]AJC93977.1 dihydropteroate synthase [Campylobacter volucris LMG 24379]KAB0580138.1 dihydropteroate synthase [Campylobacter volucris]QBL13647.1 dihydropteroate synthase [Campylobacter volucris]QEL08191.1 dihydropteroate synthase [Campylobacter volucris]TXK67535.1 dihydropteroate synthase [Campylobacter volucris]